MTTATRMLIGTAIGLMLAGAFIFALAEVANYIVKVTP